MLRHRRITAPPSCFLPGRTCLVTGGTKGIGRAVVEELAGLGARQAASDEMAACLCPWGAPRVLPKRRRHAFGDLYQPSTLCRRVYTCARSVADLEELLGHCKAQGWDVQGCVADVSKADDRQNLVAAVSQAFGGQLTVLFNNVGTNIRKPTEEYTQVGRRGEFWGAVDGLVGWCSGCSWSRVLR